MTSYDENQRVWAPDHGNGVIRSVDQTVLGIELVIDFDFGLVERRMIPSFVKTVDLEGCPRFGVFEHAERMIFCTPEPVGPEMDDFERERWVRGAVWCRLYSVSNYIGVTGEVPVSRIMPLSADDFATAKRSCWEFLPTDIPSQFDGFTL